MMASSSLSSLLNFCFLIGHAKSVCYFVCISVSLPDCMYNVFMCVCLSVCFTAALVRGNRDSSQQFASSRCNELMQLLRIPQLTHGE